MDALVNNIPFVSGAKSAEEGGHFDEFCQHPAFFLQRAYEEYGELAEFDMGGTPTVLMVGPEAHEAVFRADDISLSAPEAYQFMVPVFGKGIQYGAPLHIERQQLKIHSNGLSGDRMRFYAPVIAEETYDWCKDWGNQGQMDFYEAFGDLTIRTSTHCLLGREFRENLTDEFTDIYRILGNSVDAASFKDPYAQREAYQARDKARARLEELIAERIQVRRDSGKSYNDMLQVYMDATYQDGTPLSTSEIAGMVVWFMFAGHHTSSNTAAWVLVELAKNPEQAEAVVKEIDSIMAASPELEMKELRRMSVTDGFIHETLRMHPPLNTLTRKVVGDFSYKGHVIDKGKNVMICPYVAHRLSEYFPAPEVFDYQRKTPANRFASIPFGGGQRKCVGNVFAILQVKVIMCVLLSKYVFELAGPEATYAEIMPSLILRPAEPCVLKYKTRPQ